MSFNYKIGTTFLDSRNGKIYTYLETRSPGPNNIMLKFSISGEIRPQEFGKPMIDNYLRRGILVPLKPKEVLQHIRSSKIELPAVRQINLPSDVQTHVSRMLGYANQRHIADDHNISPPKKSRSQSNSKSSGGKNKRKSKKRKV